MFLSRAFWPPYPSGFELSCYRVHPPGRAALFPKPRGSRSRCAMDSVPTPLVPGNRPRSKSRSLIAQPRQRQSGPAPWRANSRRLFPSSTPDIQPPSIDSGSLPETVAGLTARPIFPQWSQPRNFGGAQSPRPRAIHINIFLKAAQQSPVNLSF
jgi:hypothetical protein